ncbi:MAG: glycoside hydrolase 43 family protein [Lachnospiraceae bacterium]|nr:glycoside hydrolase 43 family protein [Lachnospiraceae bacterium]
MHTTTFTNPVIWADVPDVSVIRVGEVFYMTSTTMHFNPGCPIMKSYDLVNWEIVNYVYDILEEDATMNMADGKHAYGKGSWASSLRYHEGIFYVAFAAWNTGKTYIFQTDDIERGEWQRAVLDSVYHDMSLLFDDGRVFMVYGGGNIRVIELTADATAIKPDGMDKILIPKEISSIGGEGGLNAEGSQFFKINGKYYLFAISWPIGRRRIQLCFRSDSIDGDYEGRVVYDANLTHRDDGIAQGAIIGLADGSWYGMLFQDNGAVGRTPVIMPVAFEDGWPVFGEAKGEIPVPVSTERKINHNIWLSDNFDEEKPGLQWQWNHNPVNTHWSLTERPGFLRIKTALLCDNITKARNTLTQRTFAPECTGETKMDVSEMKNGDTAGFAAFQYNYGFAGVRMANNQKQIIMVNRGGEDEVLTESIPLKQTEIYFRIKCDFSNGIDIAYFYYSLNGEEWILAGTPLNMKYTLEHFVGYRFALFNYAATEIGGYVDFDYFKIS